MAQPVALIYSYVEGMLERRAPHREAHLELVRRWSDDGRLRMAGALGDPPNGALFVFEVDDPGEIGDFTAADPYGEAGLVTETRVEPWTLVASAPLGGTR